MENSRRNLLLLVLCMLSCWLGAAQNIGATRPNVLFVFIDDIGWGDLSCYGSSVTNKLGEAITPHLDRLAAQGTRFTQAYVASPICSPSRVGVLTGMEPARFGIYSFLDNRASNAARNMADWLQPDVVTTPRLFLKAGYKTGQFGKWHMGGGRDVNNAPFPQAYGFEESLVAFEGMGNRVLYTNHNLSVQNADVPGTVEWVEWYEGAVRHTDAALQFITNAVAEQKPFYVHVPYNDTHSPYNVPPGQENDFDHITSNAEARLFLGELHNLDKQIGRLVETIDAMGLGSNTLVVVVGDNGAPNDAVETALNRNGGLRSGKGNIYEGGIRELFIVRQPGTVPAAKVNSATVVSTLDLLPTFCSFGGIGLPNAPFAGEDMSDVFRGATRPRIKPLFWEFGTVSGLSPASPKLAVREGQFKFMRDPEGSRRELYSMADDIRETTNLVNQPGYAAVIASLEAKLMAWYEEAVLGNVGETYTCAVSNFTGLAISDSFTVADGTSPGTGFGVDSGVNYQFASRVTGAAASGLLGYRLGGTGGTSPRQPSDFSIANNRLMVAPRDGNGRFEFTADGITGFNFGTFLAGRTYELAVTMNISTVGSTSQRMSVSLADVGNLAIGDVDLGLQIGSDSAGALGVFKRVDGFSNNSGADINMRLLKGLPIGVPIQLKLRVTDSNTNTTDFGSGYAILVNGTQVDSGAFRFNGSTTDRYVIFDVAAHEGPVDYDDFSLSVTSGNTGTVTCRKPVLRVSDVSIGGADECKVRLLWSAQPGLRVAPETSTDLKNWAALTSGGSPIAVTTAHGSMQWLQVPVPLNERGTFFRLRKE